jgi:hypothetical protein
VPRLSIIIPFSKDIQQLEESLVSVLENRPPEAQVLVILSEVYKDPYDIKEEVDFVFASFGESLPACLNLAVESSKAPVVHVVGCGMEVSPGWTDAPLELFSDPSVGAVVPCILDKADASRVLSAGVRFRTGGGRDRIGEGGLSEVLGPVSDNRFGPDLFGGFYRRDALASVGGFRASVGPVWGPLDTCLALRRLGYDTRLEPASRLYADPELFFRAPGFLQALEDERFFWRWAAEEPAAKSLINHGLLLTGETIRGLIRPDRLIRQWTGRLLGALSAGSQPATHADTLPFSDSSADDSGVESRRCAA